MAEKTHWYKITHSSYRLFGLLIDYCLIKLEYTEWYKLDSRNKELRLDPYTTVGNTRKLNTQNYTQAPERMIKVF